ncbi:MAG: CheR family methyltransferase [Pseudomonadota bacterium]
MAMAPALSVPSIGQTELEALLRLAHEAGGVSFAADKIDFLQLRLTPRLRETDCADFQAYVSLLRDPGAEEERQRFVEALAIHTTSFFREARHYTWMAEKGLPMLVEEMGSQSRPLVLWSAACSTGAEIWSAAMVIEDFRHAGRGLPWEAIGTDISSAILRRAASGVFTEEEIAGISDDRRRRFLLRRRADRVGRGDGELYRIVPELRQRVRFLQANLLRLDETSSFSADIAFLRNVLIYFSPADRLAVAAAVARRLRPGGFLLTGHSESFGREVAGLEQVGAAIYRRT